MADLSCFESLTQLTELDVSGMQQVVDLSPLKNLQNLRRLWLYGCQEVRDLTPLIDLKRLEVLKAAIGGIDINGDELENEAKQVPCSLIVMINHANPTIDLRSATRDW